MKPSAITAMPVALTAASVLLISCTWVRAAEPSATANDAFELRAETFASGAKLSDAERERFKKIYAAHARGVAQIETQMCDLESRLFGRWSSGTSTRDETAKLFEELEAFDRKLMDQRAAFFGTLKREFTSGRAAQLAFNERTMAMRRKVCDGEPRPAP